MLNGAAAPDGAKNGDLGPRLLFTEGRGSSAHHHSRLFESNLVMLSRIQRLHVNRVTVTSQIHTPSSSNHRTGAASLSAISNTTAMAVLAASHLIADVNVLQTVAYWLLALTRTSR